jgi:transketolase
VPDRKALGIDCYTAAARGAYLIRDFDGGKRGQGTIIVQGTISTSNVIKALPEINKRGLNVKIVAGVSPELFRLRDQAYQDPHPADGRLHRLDRDPQHVASRHV